MKSVEQNINVSATLRKLMTGKQAEKIGYIYYRLTQHREDVKTARWDDLKFIYQKLINDLIENVVMEREDE